MTHHANMERILVSIAVHSNRLDTQIACGSYNATCNLASEESEQQSKGQTTTTHRLAIKILLKRGFLSSTKAVSREAEAVRCSRALDCE